MCFEFISNERYNTASPVCLPFIQRRTRGQVRRRLCQDTHTHTQLHTHTHTNTHTHNHTHTHTHTHKDTHTQLHTYTHTQLHTHTHNYTHTHTQLHTHTITHNYTHTTNFSSTHMYTFHAQATKLSDRMSIVLSDVICFSVLFIYLFLKTTPLKENKLVQPGIFSVY